MLDSLLLSRSQRDFLDLATETYQKNVDSVASYLVDRGIGKEAAYAARLGRVSEPLAGHERFEGMLSIPYLTPAGTVAMKFRSLDPDAKQKYDGPSGQHVRLYNAGALATATGTTVCVCEGELAALVTHHVVGVPAVGAPGTQWQAHWARCLADFEQVLVVADNDEKEDGSNPGLKHAKSLVAAIPGSRLVLPPPGLDIDEWLLATDVATVRKGLGLEET